ncbi:hypothetical protein [Emticicia oligotrophica]|uniref:hypothetical protein n=1 Tax=Emticicia oligotrophica TaxID=312279 RepID=UPI00273C559E|nr:hypothetical protein [Emticicia oligotrophica]
MVNLTQSNFGDIIIIGGLEYSVAKYSFPPILPIINILNNEESVQQGIPLKVNFKAISN